MIDFTSEGPYSYRLNETMGQPYDLDQLDDVNSWIIAVAKRDKPEDIRRALEQDEWVLNYGVYPGRGHAGIGKGAEFINHVLCRLNQFCSLAKQVVAATCQWIVNRARDGKYFTTLLTGAAGADQ